MSFRDQIFDIIAEQFNNNFIKSVHHFILYKIPNVDVFKFTNTRYFKPDKAPNFKGFITLENITSIKEGPFLHEIAHTFVNNIIKTPSVIHSKLKQVKIENDISCSDNFDFIKYSKLESESSKNIGPHWGYSNINGQLGGFSEIDLKNLKNDNSHSKCYPVLNEEGTKFLLSDITFISNCSINPKFKPLDKDALQKAIDKWINNMEEACSEYGNISEWDTSEITDMSELFKDKTTFTELDDMSIGNWNTSNVTNMSRMFQGASKFEGLTLGKWDTTKVTDMSMMFWCKRV